MKRLLPILCCLLCIPDGHTQTPDQKQQTVALLQALQAPDGGFRPAFGNDAKAAEAKSSLRASTSALRALKYFGGGAKDKQACAEFINRCFDKTTGGFGDFPGGKPDAISTAIGLMAVVEVKLPVKDYSDAATAYLDDHAKSFEDVRLAAAAMEAIGGHSPMIQRWLAQITKMSNQDGTYGKGDGVARATGSAVAAILRLGAEVPQREQVVRALKEGQRADGGFGQEGKSNSDLETSYRVVRAFVMLKERPDAQRMRAFVAKCRNDDGGYGIAPGQASQVASTYFAAIIQHWLAEK